METVPLLANQLPRADLPTLAGALIEKRRGTEVPPMALCRFKPGEYLARQGDVGRELNIVKLGSCAVLRREAATENEQRVATLRPGDWSGGQALVETRSFRASVLAEPPGVTVLSISRDNFEALGLHQRLFFPRRNAMYEGRAKRAGVAQRLPGVEHVAGELSEEEVNFIARWAGRAGRLGRPGIYRYSCIHNDVRIKTDT